MFLIKFISPAIQALISHPSEFEWFEKLIQQNEFNFFYYGKTMMLQPCIAAGKILIPNSYFYDFKEKVKLFE